MQKCEQFCWSVGIVTYDSYLRILIMFRSLQKIQIRKCAKITQNLKDANSPDPHKMIKKKKRRHYNPYPRNQNSDAWKGDVICSRSAVEPKCKLRQSGSRDYALKHYAIPSLPISPRGNARKITYTELSHWVTQDMPGACHKHFVRSRILSGLLNNAKSEF